MYSLAGCRGLVVICNTMLYSICLLLNRLVRLLVMDLFLSILINNYCWLVLMILLNAANAAWIFFRSILHADEWIIIFPTLFWRRGWILCPFCLIDGCKAVRKNVADSLTPQAMARVVLVFCHVPAAHQVQCWEDQVGKGLAYIRSITQELCLSHGGQRCHLGHSATCPWDFSSRQCSLLSCQPVAVCPQMGPAKPLACRTQVGCRGKGVSTTL